jgi:signal transduction histidine kinase
VESAVLDFRAAVGTPNPPDAIALSIFRVLQEAIENVVTHAAATHVTVSLSERNGGIELEVADNGVGFDPGVAMRGTKVGLVAIRERLRLVGGTCAFESRPGAGTRLPRVPV